ncbi:hypothetical protein JOL79_21460 [Microbispora sp. RL4-1S]|uniref:Ig-like domain-containing protein n=1 Tax=Microbispora oryzae TaxID=2806554 RepID=A0A940WIY7_9ACTN|nr:hypothetical protein [Microbispora oryzae]MBP2706381.1 hypothetical protein [Microbispora oryzae]
MKSARRVLALGSALVTTGVLGLLAVPQPATASTVVVQGTVDCSNVNYSGDTSDWYPYSLQVVSGSPYTSASPSGLYAVPATHAFGFTQTLPSGSTSVGVSTLCSIGHQWDLTGSTGMVDIPAGTSTVTAAWACSTAPVYPGPWVTNCSLQSVSYS